MSERVLVNVGVNKGKMATVITDTPGRRLVYVDGYTSADGLRNYVPASLSAVPVGPPVPPVQNPYKLNTLIADEQFADLNNWHLYDGPGHANNGIRDPKAWELKSGVDGGSGNVLVCTGWWDAAVGKIRTGGMSHKLQGLVNFRVEARVKFEEDPSNTTGANFMTWPDGPGDGGWPENGEHNIWEAYNNPLRKPMGTYIHYDPDNKQKYYHHPGSDGTKWNVICMEKTEDAIRIFVNDVLSWTMTDKEAITSHPHHVTLQQDAHTNRDPGRHIRAYYDWVKVYK